MSVHFHCRRGQPTAMDSPRHFLLILVTLVLFSSLLPSGISSDSDSDSNIVADLISLRSTSPAGVIRISDQILRRIMSVPRRSFSFAVFFDAVQLQDKTELHLPSLRSEFAVVSSSFLTNNPDSRNFFFFDIEFKESQESFSLFGVNALPHIRLVTPSLDNLHNSDHLDQAHFSSLSESLSSFIESKAKISIGPIHHPPMFSGKQLAFFGLILLIWAPFAIKKILSGETLLHDHNTWLFSAVFVYFFSVSGTMHNIIRKMPMFIADRKDPSKLIFFYQGSGMQLGAEGFAVGFLYTIVGLMLAVVTHGLVRVRNLMAQRILMVLALVISFWAVRKVIYLDNWKTGYGVHGYWPSSWQ